MTGNAPVACGVPQIETARLRLRGVKLEDLPNLTRLNADPAVMRFIGDSFTPEQTREWVERIISGYRDGPPGHGWRAVEERSSGLCIGLAAIKKFSPANLDAIGELASGCADHELIEIGWRFHTEFWGRGYATETGSALVAYGFADLNLPRILAAALSENFASCKAIQKCGLRPIGEFCFQGRPARLFGCLRLQP